MYTGQRFFVQQLSLQHLNVDVRRNNNALKELNDCIGGLLHLVLVTTAACPRPGASFSNRNVAKKSEMFISLSQAKYNITNWHFYNT